MTVRRHRKITNLKSRINQRQFLVKIFASYVENFSREKKVKKKFILSSCESGRNRKENTEPTDCAYMRKEEILGQRKNLINISNLFLASEK